MDRKTLRAVHDDDLVAFLRHVGLLDDLQAGRVVCRYCEDPLNLQTLEAIYPEHGQIRAVCSKPSCLLRLAKDRFNA